MAKARTRCDRCKKRRTTQFYRVRMDRVDLEPTPISHRLLNRNWDLCSECAEHCTAQIKAAFRDQPE